ncbi:MAG: hypothetical protein U0401_11025 [Anaerolineae bacterium]
MMKKMMIGFLTTAMLLSAGVWGPLLPSHVGTAAAQEAIVAPSSPVNQAAQFVPYTPEMKVLFDEMTLVWLQAEEYGYITAACVGNGLKLVASVDHNLRSRANPNQFNHFVNTALDQTICFMVPNLTLEPPSRWQFALMIYWLYHLVLH